MGSVTGLETFSQRIRIMDAIESVVDILGKEMVKTIRDRVRLGYGVSGDKQSKTKFLPLLPSTIASRKRMEAKGLLLDGSNAKRSHLTMTGQMMDNLVYQKEPTKLVILFDDTFAEDKANYHHDGVRSSQGLRKRPFMFLTNMEFKAATRIIQKGLDDYFDAIARSL
jgi:hypothetical protein